MQTTRTGLLTLTFQVERAEGEHGVEEREVVLESIEPRGTHEPSGDVCEDSKWSGFRCACQDPVVMDTNEDWEGASPSPIESCSTSMCDACACEYSIDCMGVEDFLTSAEVPYSNLGTLVVRGRLVWEHGQTIDGDYDDETFEVGSVEWG